MIRHFIIISQRHFSLLNNIRYLEFSTLKKNEQNSHKTMGFQEQNPENNKEEVAQSYCSPKQNNRMAKRMAYLFGGQGTHQPKMFTKYTLEEWDNKKHFAQQLQTIKQQSRLLSIDFMEIGTTDNYKLLNKTEFTQPILVLEHWLQYQRIRKTSNIPDHNENEIYFIGHSLGQYSALLTAGCISLQECLNLVNIRGKLMTQCSNGKESRSSLIVRFKKQKEKSVFKIIQEQQQLQGNVQIGCFNSPVNIVVSGTVQQNALLAKRLKSELKVSSMVLPVSTAFHCRDLQQMKQPFLKHLKQIKWNQDPLKSCKIPRNIDGQLYKSKDDIIEGLSRQNTEPVKFSQTIQSLIISADRQAEHQLQFLELGESNHLTKWVNEIQNSFK